MRFGPSDTVLASAASWECRVSSWLGGTLLAGDVPILSGHATGHVSRRVQKHVTFTVPPFTVESGRTVDWLPEKADDALARYGQVVDVTMSVAGVDSRIGRYLIVNWDENDDGSITVESDGLQRWADDDRFLTAVGPRDGGTLISEARRMLPGYMSAAFADGLIDRAVPLVMQWNENRLDNLYSIADTWPARLREDEWGQMVFSPPLPEVPTPVLSYRDGGPEMKTVTVTTGDVYPADDIYPLDDRYPGGTVVSELPVGPGGSLMAAPVSDTRDGAYNVFVARSSAQDVDVQAVVQVLSGPMDPTGPYRPVPKFLAAPTLTTYEQCRAAAESMRDAAVRESTIRKVTIAPDPRPDLDDAVETITGWGTPHQARQWGYVVGYDIGLTVNDGPTRLDITG